MKETCPFTCPKCGHTSPEFHPVCPECKRPFVRDYIDTRVHPRDPDPTGVCTSRFWIWVMLIMTLGGIVLYLLSGFGLLRGIIP